VLAPYLTFVWFINVFTRAHKADPVSKLKGDYFSNIC